MPLPKSKLFKNAWVRITYKDKMPYGLDDDGHPQGPWSLPNQTEWYVYSDQNLKHAQYKASYWKDKGYETVVEIVLKP